MFVGVSNWKPPKYPQWMDKKIVVYHYNWLLNNKKEWTNDITDKIKGSQNNYAEWKKPNKMRHMSWYYLCNFLEMQMNL